MDTIPIREGVECYPCGVQWYAVEGFLYVVLFMVVGMALCWWIDTRFPVASGTGRSPGGPDA